MSYGNLHWGNTWQQGGSPVGIGGYNQNYGVYNDQFGISDQMRNACYNLNEGGSRGGMYAGRVMAQMGNMGYGGPSPSRNYMNDRMSDRSMGRGQMKRKRLPQRSPASGPRSKRPNIKSDRRLDDGKPKKPLICYVCKVSFLNKERFTKHQCSKSRTAKIEHFVIRREKKKGTTDDEKKEKDSSEQDKKNSNRKPGNWCTVCDCAFTGNFLIHRRKKEHKKKRDEKYPKCLPCGLSFGSSEECRDHFKSDEHKQRSAEFHYLRNLASGSDEDEAAIDLAKVEEDKTEEEKIQETSEEKAEDENVTEFEGKEKSADGKRDDIKDKDEKTDTKDQKEKQEVKKPKPKEPNCVGLSFVRPVKGYYCKLCHKFFKDVTVAKSKHCRSVMHTEAFKKAMEEAVEQEEKRQKLAAEEDKQNKETAEAEELAAEIAVIKRAAKEAAKKEFSSKKAGTAKDEDVEMKEVSEDVSKYAAASKEVKNECANEDGMENDIKDGMENGIKEEIKDGMENGIKEEIKDGMENGIKEEIKDDVDDSEDPKYSAAEDKKDCEAIKEEPVDEV